MTPFERLLAIVAADLERAFGSAATASADLVAEDLIRGCPRPAETEE